MKDRDCITAALRLINRISDQVFAFIKNSSALKVHYRPNGKSYTEGLQNINQNYCDITKTQNYNLYETLWCDIDFVKPYLFYLWLILYSDLIDLASDKSILNSFSRFLLSQEHSETSDNTITIPVKMSKVKLGHSVT